MKTFATNRRARYDYDLGETILAGVILSGSEVKSIRNNHVSLKGSYVVLKNGELYLRGALINRYQPAGDLNHDPSRDRKLLVTKNQQKMFVANRQNGHYIIPIRLVEKRGFIKLAVATGRSKTKHDKRRSIKKKDIRRDINRELSR
jgi:SsrA-binding protein